MTGLILVSVVPRGSYGVGIGGKQWDCPDQHLFCLMLALLLFAFLCSFMAHDKSDFRVECVQ